MPLFQTFETERDRVVDPKFLNAARATGNSQVPTPRYSVSTDARPKGVA